MSMRTGKILYILTWPVLYFILNGSNRTRVAITSQGSILLIRSFVGNGYWGLPGGGLHRNEPPADGAAREVEEEVGIHIDVEAMRPLSIEQSGDSGFRFTCHFFTAELSAPGDIVRQTSEIADARWFPLDAIPEDGVKAETRRALALLRDH